MAISARTIRAIIRKQRKEEIEAKKSECNKAADKLKAKVKSWLKKEFGLGKYDFTCGVYFGVSVEDQYNAPEYTIHVCYFKGNKKEVYTKFMEMFDGKKFKGFQCKAGGNHDYEDMEHYRDLHVTIYNNK